MRAVAADGLIRLPPKVNAMSTAPPFGSRTGHDWLMVGTAGPATRRRRSGAGQAVAAVV